jgi:bacterioferritin-associated ferredoxin
LILKVVVPGSLAMVLCVCHAVTEREIDDLIRRGAGTASTIGEQCGAGTDCGACVNAIESRCARTGAPCTGPGAHSHDEKAAKTSPAGA